MGMKRYGILLVSTLLLAMGIRVAGSLVREEVPVVEYRVTQAQTVEDRVVCSGKIESAQSEKVYVSMPCIAGEVYVQAGDAVKKGQKLFSVDVGATQQVLAALGESVGALAIDNIEEEITSPVDGIVTALNVVQGEAAEPEEACAVISSSSALQVAVTIGEKDIRKVQEGQEVHVSGMAFDQENYAGTVTYLSPSARQLVSGTTTETVVDAVITLQETDASLRPGLTAKASIVTGSSPHVILAAYEDVLQDEDEIEFVFVYQRGRAYKRVIETGAERSEGFEVLSGLEEGETVISVPSEEWRDGQRVQLAGRE